MTAIKRKPLLSTNNKKTMKGEKLGYKTYILYLSPFKANSLGKNVCSHASKGCVASCLTHSGFGGMYVNVKQGRINKTEYFLSSRMEFLNQLHTEIGKAIKKNEGKAIVTIRLNGTSDIPYENFRVFEGGKNIFECYPDTIFYDYTKNWTRYNKVLPANYSLTFSKSETNTDKAFELLDKGFNVAFVFDKTPTEYKGYRVIDADNNDLRFLDPKGVIVGLRYKYMTGKNANNKLAFESGFAIRLIQDTVKRYKKVSYKFIPKEVLDRVKRNVLELAE